MNLKDRITGPIIAQQDPSYNRARRVWNERFDRYPQEIIYPQNVAEVSTVLLYTLAKKASFRIRSGGHCVEGYSTIDDGIIIDLSDLTAIRVNDDRTLAVVEAGARLRDVYSQLWKAGTTLPAGICPDIRMGGHVLGGGLGMLVRSRGMLVDSLIAVELVDAQGCVLSIDADSHPDLFWACQGGGGGSFGIATSFTFRLRPITAVTFFSIGWSWADFDRVLDVWQRWLPDADQRINARFVMGAESSNSVSTSGLFEGTEEQLYHLLTPAMVCQPTYRTVKTLPFIETVGAFTQTVPSTRAKFVPGFASEPFNEQAIQILRKWHERAPLGVKTSLYGLGGRVLTQPSPSETAFVHRSARVCVEYLGHWTSPDDDQSHLEWLTGIRDEMRPHMTGGAYVNSRDCTLENWPHAYFGGNLPRLVEIKNRYDPDDVFTFPQSIPLSFSFDEARARQFPDSTITVLKRADLLRDVRNESHRLQENL
jgi:FAD/FMN-containing dehydrogenase